MFAIYLYTRFLSRGGIDLSVGIFIILLYFSMGLLEDRFSEFCHFPAVSTTSAISSTIRSFENISPNVIIDFVIFLFPRLSFRLLGRLFFRVPAVLYFPSTLANSRLSSLSSSSFVFVVASNVLVNSVAAPSLSLTWFPHQLIVLRPRVRRLGSPLYWSSSPFRILMRRLSRAPIFRRNPSILIGLPLCPRRVSRTWKFHYLVHPLCTIRLSYIRLARTILYNTVICVCPGCQSFGFCSSFAAAIELEINLNEPLLKLVEMVQDRALSDLPLSCYAFVI